MSVVGLLALGLTVVPALALHVNRVSAKSALEFVAGPLRVRGPDIATPLDDLDHPFKPTTTTTSTTTTSTTTPPTRATTAPPPPPANSPGPSRTASGQASWYPGEKRYCAHRTLAIGTLVTVTNLGNGRQTRCTVTNRGPFEEGRIIDLTKAVFAELASPWQGVIDVRLDW